MERRKHRRQSRRILVSFWAGGKKYNGYTTNISIDGMFIATGHLAAKGTNVQIEVADKEWNFVLDAVVVRTKQVPVEMRRIQQGGFAVRFLANAEPIKNLLPKQEEADDDTSPDAVAPFSQVCKVAFTSPAHFLEVYQREIRNGVLFVATPGHVDIDDIVLVEIQPPAGAGGGAGQGVRSAARVVFAGDASSQGRVGVKLDDLPGVLEDLQPFVDRVRPPPGR